VYKFDPHWFEFTTCEQECAKYTETLIKMRPSVSILKVCDVNIYLTVEKSAFIKMLSANVIPVNSQNNTSNLQLKL
jgi:hypothetical protein